MSLDLLLQGSITWLLLAVVCSVALGLSLRRWAGRVRQLSLSGRPVALVLMCWSPALVATMITAGCYLPGWLASAGLTVDHCHLHEGHAHLCMGHVQPVALGLASWGLVGAVVAWLAIGLRSLLGDVHQGMSLHRGLCSLADDEDVSIVEAAVPLSITTGLWAPRVFVTSALLDVLSPSQRSVVVAHERCHVHERHAFLKLLAAVGALVLGPAARGTLLRALALACERRADEAAAAVTGDRLEVASALLVTRRAQQHLPCGVLAFQGADDLALRVRALSDGETPAADGGFTAAATGLALLAFVAGHQLHHGIETLLTLFIG